MVLAIIIIAHIIQNPIPDIRKNELIGFSGAIFSTGTYSTTGVLTNIVSRMVSGSCSALSAVCPAVFTANEALAFPAVVETPLFLIAARINESQSGQGSLVVGNSNGISLSLYPITVSIIISRTVSLDFRYGWRLIILVKRCCGEHARNSPTKRLIHSASLKTVAFIYASFAFSLIINE